MSEDQGFKSHLISRNYNPDLYINHTINEDDKLLTVHIYNPNGKMVGYQTYNPSGSKKTNPTTEAKYNTYCMKGEVAFWGLETLDYSKPDLFIVEGLFKASALHNIGYNAVCVFGSNAKHIKDWLLSTPFNIIAIGDNDKGGEGLVKSIQHIGGVGIILDNDVDEYTPVELAAIMVELGY